MSLLVVGLNYNTAPVGVREKVALGVNQVKEALLSLHDYVDGGVILTTCNRTEVYAIGYELGSTEEKVKNFLYTQSGLSSSELSPHLYTHRQEAAVRHLFKVASGLDSMILGEFEILGQVRQALEAVENTDLAPLPLLNLFRQAVGVGRRVREETSISRNAASVSSAAVEMARIVFTDLSTCKVLVIGAGEAGKLVARALAKNGVSQMVVASRTYERALALASTIGGGAVPIQSIKEALSTPDIVISCSGSPHFIVESPVVEKNMKARPNCPLVIIDIAVPRDVNPEVKNVENVFLYDIDDLTDISESNRKQREREIDNVMNIVDAEVTRFMSWWNSLEVKPVITALTNKAENIRRDRLNKTLSKLDSLSEEDRTKIEAMTKSIVRRVLHDPILYLKNSNDGNQYTQVVRKLFKLSEEKKPTDKSIGKS